MGHKIFTDKNASSNQSNIEKDIDIEKNIEAYDAK